MSGEATRPNFPGAEQPGRCQCGQPATVVVVTWLDWIYELCPQCAVDACDPIQAQRA